MAYARFSRTSDVYVYEEEGSVVCLECRLGLAFETRTPTRSAMIAHLEAHLSAGHNVPSSAFDELRSQIVKQGEIV